MWKGSIWGAGFRIPFLRFTHCETSSLLPQSGSSSRALGGSRSQKQIGTCHGQIQMPLKPLFILVFQKVKKKQTGAVCQEYPRSPSCGHHFLPFGAGDIENICFQMQREEDSLLPSLLSRGPSGFPASLFRIPLLPGMPVNSNPNPAVQVRHYTEQFLQPSWTARDQFSTPQPCSSHLGMGVRPVHNSLKKEKMTIQSLIFIPHPVLGELSGLHFSTAMQCTVTLPLGPSN